MKWVCGIPGKDGTLWEGGTFPLTIEFSDDYPSKPPKCKFPAGFFHPEHLPVGHRLSQHHRRRQGLEATITVKQILLGVQDLLDNPNPNDPAQADAFHLFLQNKSEYERRVKLQSQKYVLQ
jgi:ubiquitin-conjugating enzyme E2 I